MNTAADDRFLSIIAPSLDDKRIHPVRRLEPGAVHRTRAVLSHASGKGANAARAAAALGGRVQLCAFAGPRLRALLEEQFAYNGITLAVADTVQETRSCITVLEEDGRATEFVQEALPVGEDERTEFTRLALRTAAQDGVVLMAGSLPPGLAEDFYVVIANQAYGHGARVVIDAHRFPLRAALAGHPDVVKINREELIATVRDPLANAFPGVAGAHAGSTARADSTTKVDRNTDPGSTANAGNSEADAQPEGTDDERHTDTAALAHTIIEWGARSVVVTDGGKPVLLLKEAEEAEYLSVPEVDVVNAVGSGDAMSGALSLALLRGMPLRDAVRFGIAAGSANAATLLPGDVDSSTVERLYDAIP